MRLLLLKSAKFANQAGYYLLNGRWHSIKQDKPAPKGAPQAAHPHAAGTPVQKQTLAQDEWAQLQLPAENVNAGTFNKQLGQLKAAADAGDVTGIVASGYGTNTYGKKLAIIANHVLGLLGSDHKVTPGQKAGSHTAVQTAPEIEAGKPEPKPEPAAAPAPKQEEPAPAKQITPDDLKVPEFEEGKVSKGVKKHYETQAKKIIVAAKAEDLAVLQFMVQPDKGQSWKGKTPNSKKLLELHAQAVSALGGLHQSKEVTHPDAAKKAKQEEKELANENVKPEPAPKPEPKPAPAPVEKVEPEPKKFKNYSWKAIELAKHYTIPELEAAMKDVEAEHAGTGTGIQLYDKAGQKKLDALTWAITHIAKAEKKAEEQKPKPEPKKSDAERKPAVQAITKEATDAKSKLSQIPWDSLMLPDTNSNAKSHNGKVAQIKAMAEAGDIEGLKNFKAGVNTYGKKQNLLAQTALAALEEDAPAAAAPSKPEKAETPPPAEKQPETTSPGIEIPTPPKFGDFNTDLVAKAWVKMAKEGKIPDLMASIHTLAANAKKSPKSFQTDDGGKLLDFAKDMAKWVSNSAPEPAEKAPALAGMPEKPAGASPTYDKIEQAMLDADTDKLAEIIELKSEFADKSSISPGKKAYDYATAAYKFVMGKDYVSPAASQPGNDENSGPNEGETKQGADGMLVFKNGRWHKVEDKASQEKPAPAGPADVQIPTFNHTVAKNNTLLTQLAEGLKQLAVEQGAAGIKGPITNHKDGTVSVYIPGIAKIKKAGVNSSPAFAEFAKFVDELKASVGKKKAQPKPKAAPAPAAPAPEPSKQVESMDSWEQVGGQGGSNPGGKFKDADGVEWYCKFPENEDVAKAEVTAAKLYTALGLNAQDAKLITKGGKVGIASRWQDVKKASPAELKKTPGVIEGFAADAWLANWDVVGMAYDNLQVDSKGHAMRVDAGGSLMYRAQGGKKAFGDTVPELDSLRDAALNPQAAAVFGKLTKADITASVAKVAQLSDAQIRIICDQNGPGTKAERKQLAETLIARKADLLAKYPKAGKIAKKRLDPNNLPVKEDRLPKLHDFANWNGPGAGLSSQGHINDANHQVEQEMMDLAKTGNLTKLKDFKFKAVDKSTGQSGEETPISQHPSKHVVQLHSDLVQLLDEIANPPQPLKIFQETDVDSLEALDVAFPSKKFGTTVNSVHSNEKLGFWVVLGGVHGAAEKFKPKKLLNFTTEAIQSAYTKFSEASKLAKHFISSVQKSGSYNDLFRDGKEFDHEGNKLSDVAQAALGFATSQPEGTRLYRWQNMSDDMVKKIMGAPDGSIFQATGPMCTSYSPTATNHFGKHRVTFVYADGAKAVESFGSGKFAGEKEITTLPNSRFVILSKKMVKDDIKGDKERMELEVLMLPPDLGV